MDDAKAATFGQVHFGQADLVFATVELVRVADQLALHPGDTFPKKFHQPADLKDSIG